MSPASATSMSFHGLARIVADLDAILWEADAESFRMKWVGGHLGAFLGHAPEDWTATPDFWVRHLHPDDRESAVADWRGAIAARRDHRLEYRMIAGDGRAVWLEHVARFIPETEGRAAVVRGVLVDIEQRKI